MKHKLDKPEPSRVIDARVAKTGSALQNALLALLDRESWEQITIRQIAAEAGVHYATFFRHHPTKGALLDAVAADQIDRLVGLTLPLMKHADRHAAHIALCAYVDAHRMLWKVLLTGGAASTMRAELLRISRNISVAQTAKADWLPVELAVASTVSLIFETLSWWLAQDHGSFSIDRVASILDRLLRSSTLQARSSPQSVPSI
jgi:AcrR family transcriptional regulator